MPAKVVGREQLVSLGREGDVAGHNRQKNFPHGIQEGDRPVHLRDIILRFAWFL